LELALRPELSLQQWQRGTTRRDYHSNDRDQLFLGEESTMLVGGLLIADVYASTPTL
jgi:hypothetical protein